MHIMVYLICKISDVLHHIQDILGIGQHSYFTELFIYQRSNRFYLEIVMEIQTESPCICPTPWLGGRPDIRLSESDIAGDHV